MVEVVELVGLITCERVVFPHGAILLIWRLMLGVLDIMGVEAQNREQVEVRENVEARETEEDKTKKQQTLRHVMTCG